MSLHCPWNTVSAQNRAEVLVIIVNVQTSILIKHIIFQYVNYSGTFKVWILFGGWAII